MSRLYITSIVNGGQVERAVRFVARRESALGRPRFEALLSRDYFRIIVWR